jgi:2,4-dienoyl-CoA reductase-like NADH-dependent reductase (Old Yellow Enzyme family)/thioredoxin reductase
MASQDYSNVTRPISIGPVTVPNRIVRTAAGTGLAGPEVTDEFIHYHLARAEGGVGLVILGDAQIHRSTGGRIPLWSDEVIPGFRRMSDAFHASGRVLFQELSHHGSAAVTGGVAWSASARPDSLTGAVSLEMTQEMIDEIIAAFAGAAARSKAAGLDGVEIHAGHGFLISQFLSPLTNARIDAYGGSPDRRLRFLREVLAATRGAVGSQFPIGVRVSASECIDGGLTVDDTRQIVDRLQSDGVVDFVDVSLGHLASYHKLIGGMHEPRGYQISETSKITANCDLPTIVAGRIDSLQLAETLLAAHIADMVSMMRATIADPELVNKTLTGRIAEIRPCIACNECLKAVGGPDRRIACAVNPHVVPIRPARRMGRRVLVVGGGPAGMAAARESALSGDQVVLLEASSQLGGAARIASLAPHREDLGNFVAWQERELRRLGVDVRLGATEEKKIVDTMRPDLIVIATGAAARRAVTSAVEGPQRLGDASEIRIWLPAQVHEHAPSDIERALVFDEMGTYEAIGAAEHLAKLGAKVTLVSRFDVVGAEIRATLEAIPALTRLASAGVRVIHDHVVRCVEATTIPLESTADGSIMREDTDLLVVCAGYEADETWRVLLDDWNGEVCVVGDASVPAGLRAAIASGASAAVSTAAIG